MKLKYSLIFLLVTLLCVGGVEGFYYLLGRRLAADQAGETATPGTDLAVASAESLKVKRDIDISAIARRNLFASRSDRQGRADKHRPPGRSENVFSCCGTDGNHNGKR